MSTQVFSSLSIETQNPLTTEDTEEHREQPQSVLDEPWRVRMLAAPEAAERKKSLPWRMGDVARLKDDSPEGMMKYIATHTTGWWQEMAERGVQRKVSRESMRMNTNAGTGSGHRIIETSGHRDSRHRKRKISGRKAERGTKKPINSMISTDLDRIPQRKARSRSI